MSESDKNKERCSVLMCARVKECVSHGLKFTKPRHTHIYDTHLTKNSSVRHYACGNAHCGLLHSLFMHLYAVSHSCISHIQHMFF